MRPEDCQCVHAHFGCDFEERVSAMTPVVEAAVAVIDDGNIMCCCDEDETGVCRLRELTAAVRKYKEEVK